MDPWDVVDRRIVKKAFPKRGCNTCMHGGDGAAGESFRRRIATPERPFLVGKTGTEVQVEFPCDTSIRGSGTFDPIAIFRCQLHVYRAPAGSWRSALWNPD